MKKGKLKGQVGVGDLRQVPETAGKRHVIVVQGGAGWHTWCMAAHAARVAGVSISHHHRDCVY